MPKREDYNQIKRLTPKMEEAREVVEKFIKERKQPPSYNIIARKLKIDHSTAYYRLRGYRDKMRRRDGRGERIGEAH